MVSLFYMILSVVLILFIITLIGIILIKFLTTENNLFVLLPAGMIWGITIYIFLLNFTSKFLPGQNGILLSTFCLILIGLTALVLTPSINIKIERPGFLALLIFLALVILVVYFARLKMTSILPVADSNMQWAYAASFARGNYPTKVPWQPDLSPTYHLGAYFLEGALLSLSKLPLITIHTILNTYYLIAGALFAIFIFWETKYSFRNIWLIVSSLILYLSFGVIVFILPTENFLKNIHNPIEIYSSLTVFPQNSLPKGTSGAALVDLDSLSYLPARSLGLGLAFLVLYFNLVLFKNLKFKILSLCVLLAVIALVEESMFLPIILVISLIFVISFFTFIPIFRFLKEERKILFLILLLTTALVIFQGGFVADLLSQEESSFNITLPFLHPSFMNKIQMLVGYNIVSDSKIFSFLFPSPLFLSILMLIYAFFTKTKSLYIISLYSLTSLLCFLLIEYRYYPSNNIRFYNFSNISAGIGIIYLIFNILKSRSLRQNLIVLIITSLFILTPSLLPELIIQSNQINVARQKNIRSHVLINSTTQTPFEEISNWASKSLPLNSRIISLDTSQPTPNRSLQFQYKGLYTILGPQHIHTVRPEPGPEFFDLSLTLNPFLLKQTKTEYIYIESAAPSYQQLPQFRKDNLSNNNYFEVLKSIDTKNGLGQDIFYRLIKILPSYLDPKENVLGIKNGTLFYLEELIPKNSTVFISDYGEGQLSFWYRMSIILALRNKDLYRNLSQTDYQAIETFITYKSSDFDKEYDFYILGPLEKPTSPSKLIWSNIYATAWRKI